MSYSSITVVGNSNNNDETSKTEAEQQTTCAKILRWEWRLFLATFSFGLFALAIYMICFYVRSILTANLAAWDITMPGMYRADNFKSNAGLSSHFIGAAYFVLMAPLQYVPSFRRKYLNFHRWNGRVAVSLLGITVLGGYVYLWEAGVSQIPPEYQTSANMSMYTFGALVFVCCGMIYYHAAVSKQIDKHQLWAYRLGGIVFGSQMYFRLIFLVEAMIMGENFVITSMASVLFVMWTFAMPFVLLGGVVYWKLHGQKKNKGEQQNGEAQQLIERGGDEKYEGEMKNTSWRDVGKAIVYAILLLTFIVTLMIWIVSSWLPYCTVDLKNPVLPRWVKSLYADAVVYDQ